VPRTWTPAERREHSERLQRYYDRNPDARELARQRALDFYSSDRGRKVLRQLRRNAAVRSAIIDAVSAALAEEKEVLNLTELRKDVERAMKH
jgi:hypothetical protein